MLTPSPNEELLLVDGTGGVTLVRKTPFGTFTKSKTALIPYPKSHDDGDWERRPLTRPSQDASPSPHAQEEILPLYQRKARDRLARRLKTLKQSVVRLERDRKRAQASFLSSDDGTLAVLSEVIHQVKAGDTAVTVIRPDGSQVTIDLDPTLSPGKNLSALYEKQKKALRADTVLKKQLAQTSDEVNVISEKLTRLRSSRLTEAEVQTQLKGHRLTPEQSPVKHRSTKGPEPAYRTYQWQDAGSSQAIQILVSKSAEQGDDLCRSAKGSDLWVHVQQGVGCHVIIKTPQRRGEIPEGAKRVAQILALHFSGQKNEKRGEVYQTHRQHIMKKKHLPAGLWLVQRADTVWVSYTDDDLNAALRLVLS